MIKEDVLIELYWNQELSCRQVAEKLSCGHRKVMYYMKKYNIPRRTRSQSLKGNKNPMYGKTHSQECKDKLSKSSKAYCNLPGKIEEMSSRVSGTKNPWPNWRSYR